jgi:Baculovirus FP protein
VKSPGLQCNGSCKKFYHTACGGISDEAFETYANDPDNFSWVCMTCKGKRRSVIYKQADLVDEEDDGQPLTPKNPERNHLGKIINNKKKSDPVVLQAIQDSQDFLSGRFDDIMAQLSTLKEENAGLKTRMEHLEMKCSSLEYTIYNLEREADTAKRQQLAGNLIVHGIPYTSNNENPTEIIMNIAAKLDHPLDESSILSCSRLTNSNKAATARAPLLVKFANPATKKVLFSKLRERKGLLLSEVYADLPSDSRAKISLRDDLTPLQRSLYKEAKDMQQLFELKFAWMKDGAIFVRQTENSKVYQINSKIDIVKVADIFSKKQ